jgi:hypothetical protein
MRCVTGKLCLPCENLELCTEPEDRRAADVQPPSADPGTACAAAWKPILEWVPSHSGFLVEAPQRHSQTLPFVGRTRRRSDHF